MGDEVKKVGEGVPPPPAVAPQPVMEEVSVGPAAPTDAYVEGPVPAAPDAGLVREAASTLTPGDLFIRRLHAGPPQVVAIGVLVDIRVEFDRLRGEFFQRVLTEILSVQFWNKFASIKRNLRLVYEIISRTTYVFKGGRRASGSKILEEMAYREYMDSYHRRSGVVPKPREEALQIPDYEPFTVFERVINFKTGRGGEAEDAIEIEALRGINWSDAEPTDPIPFENVLTEILTKQFGGDPSRMASTAIVTRSYFSPEGTKIRGLRILISYLQTVCRIEQARPEAERIRLNRRSPADGLNYFLRYVLHYRSQEDQHSFELEALRQYHFDLFRRVQMTRLPLRAVSLMKQVIERALTEILEKQFGGDPQAMSLNAMRGTTYVNPADGKKIAAATLFGHYAYCRLCLSEQGTVVSGWQKVFPSADCLDYFKREILKITDYESASPAGLTAFIRDHHLEELFEMFGADPALLMEALTFLKRDELAYQDIAGLVRAYVGLEVLRTARGAARVTEENSWEKRRKYIVALVGSIESGAKIDLSDDNLRRQVDLLVILSRKAFQENPEGLIAELRAQAASARHPFVQRLHAEAAEHFAAVLSFEVTRMRSPIYAYQKEGVRFLATHNRALLADEAGMGKSFEVIAAVESLGLKKVLWVTNASNKDNLKEEILTHSYATEDDIGIVISGDPAERAKQVRAVGSQRYLIVNYETLVALQHDDPEGYALLTKDLDVVVVDEAQLMDNPKTLRTNAIRGIAAERKWLLSATPYQSRPENIWSLLHYLRPEKYPDFGAFKRMYTESARGLLLLHRELQSIMLRRMAESTLTYFRPESEVPFAEQLTDGIPRLPRRRRVPVEESGSYSLSQDQADLIAWMIADFEGWVRDFNATLPDGAQQIFPETIHPLLKFRMIEKVIYEPEYFGITTPNPIYEALDRIVEERLARGEKIILWAWNRAVLDKLEQRYQTRGVRRIDGEVTGSERTRARHDFQERNDVRILVANYVSGGVGLSITAAHAAIFVQFPPVFPLYYQTERRHQRLIGPRQVRQAKEVVDVVNLVGRLPEGFVSGLKNRRLADILSFGTLVEQTAARLEGGELMYNLVMAGFGNMELFDNYFKAGLIAGMGLTREEKLDYVSHLRGKARVTAEVILELLPLWNLVRESPAAQERVLELIDILTGYPQLAVRIGEAFAKTSRFYAEDIDFLLSIFSIKNRYIRNQMLAHLPDLVSRIYLQGKSLAEIAEGLRFGKLTADAFVAQMYIAGGLGGEAVTGLSRGLSEMRDTPIKKQWEEKFFSGVFGIMGHKVSGELLDRWAPLMSGRSVEETITILYRLGLLARTNVELLDELRFVPVDRWETLDSLLAAAVETAVARFADRPREAVRDLLAARPEWEGSVDHLLALVAGWIEQDDQKLLDQAREVFSHILDSDLHEWRNGTNDRAAGKSIDFLEDNADFWDLFGDNHRSRIGALRLVPDRFNETLFKDYLSIVEEFRQEGALVEGEWVKKEWDLLEALPSSKAREVRKPLIALFRKEATLLGKLLGAAEVNDETTALLKKYDLQVADTLESKMQIRGRLEEIRRLTAWLVIADSFDEIREGESPDWDLLVRLLEAKARHAYARKFDKLAQHLDDLKDSVIRRKSEETVFDDVVIEDTDDPAIVSRMGALTPEMVNCFNPNGNPTFTQFVIAALGSKNMKLVVVRSQGEIVAAAMVKVKRLEKGKPVFYLEKGVYRQGYDFRNEMLAHLTLKAELWKGEAALKAQVMDEVRGGGRGTDREVFGIGAYTEQEYVEPVFGLRRADKVRHKGRLVQLKVHPAHRLVETGEGLVRAAPTVQADTGAVGTGVAVSTPIVLPVAGTTTREPEKAMGGLQIDGNLALSVIPADDVILAPSGARKAGIQHPLLPEPRTGSPFQTAARGGDDKTGGDDIKMKLISLAQSRGLPEVAKFLARLDEEQIRKLVRVSGEWRSILQRRGYGTLVAGIRETLSASDRVFLIAAALARFDRELLSIIPSLGRFPIGAATGSNSLPTGVQLPPPPPSATLPIIR